MDERFYDSVEITVSLIWLGTDEGTRRIELKRRRLSEFSAISPELFSQR